MGLLGSITKGLFGGKKKTTSNKSTATTTQNATTTASSVQNPYAPVVPYVDSYLPETQALYQNTPLFSPMELQGFQGVQDAATAGTADINAAAAENNKTLSGQYLTPDTNPYLRDIATRISGIAGANAATAFGGRGRTGSGLAGYYHGKAVGDSLTDLYGNAYEAERSRMGSAVGQAPGLAAARYNAPEALMTTGQRITDRPLERNLQYGGILSSIAGLGGSTSGTTNTQGTTNLVSNSQNYKQTKGLLGKIFDSTINKLFGT